MDIFGLHAACYVVVSTLFSVAMIHRETGLPWLAFAFLVPLLLAAHCLAVVLVTKDSWAQSANQSGIEAHVKLAGLWILTFVTLMASVQ